jgi:nucleoside 2-deoxyribosyltransferase
MKDRYSIYLAGPIHGLAYDTAVSWRQYVIDRLPSEILAYSPMRAKKYLQHELELGHSYENFPLSTAKGIFNRDHHDCKTKDLIFINLYNTTKISIGTVMEIAWGHAYGKPMVLVIEPGNINIHSHPMILEACSYIVDDLDVGIDVIKAILLPEEH